MKYKVVLFDLDYTLVDATEGIRKCIEFSLTTLNSSYNASLIPKTIGLSFHDAYKYLTNDDCPHNTLKYEKYFLEKAKECLTLNTTFFNDSIFTLKYLQKIGLKIGLVTSKYRAEVIELIEKFSLLRVFDVIVTGDDNVSSKPSPEPIISALSQLNIPTDQCLYVGDSLVDAKASFNADVDFLAITKGTTTREELELEPNIGIVDTLSELILREDIFPTLRSTDSVKYTLATDIQALINNHIINLGGYWAPEFGLARMFEEIGELFSSINNDHFSEELADIFIISTCLANQYCADLSVTHNVASLKNLTNHTCNLLLSNLVIHTGELARTINCYEGPKPAKPNEQINTIETLIAKIHGIIFKITELKDINLYKEICKKLIKTMKRDLGRFSESFDPSTANSAKIFKVIQGKTPCVYARNAKIWGSPNWDNTLDIKLNIINMIPHLKRFIKVGVAEGLDAFVIAAPDQFGQSISALSKFLKQVLHEIAKTDINNCMIQDIGSPEWQFTYNQTRLFVTTFASCYPSNSSRYSYSLETTFIVFQPETSFIANKIPRGINDQIRKKIRANFKKNGQPYDNKIIASNSEAARYIKPVELNDDVVCWWK